MKVQDAIISDAIIYPEMDISWTDVGLCMAMYGYVGLCRIMWGYVGLCMDMHGYVGLCRVMFGYVEQFALCSIVLEIVMLYINVSNHYMMHTPRTYRVR